jgi:hypothetical protein
VGQYCAPIAGHDWAPIDTLAAADQNLAGANPAEPDPQLRLFADVTGWSIAAWRFALAFWPIVLAELCASLGYVLTSSMAAKASAQPPRSFFAWTAWPGAGRAQNAAKTAPIAPANVGSDNSTLPEAKAPKLSWPRLAPSP